MIPRQLTTKQADFDEDLSYRFRCCPKKRHRGDIVTCLRHKTVPDVSIRADFNVPVGQSVANCSLAERFSQILFALGVVGTNIA
jgi:hypothetical protein